LPTAEARERLVRRCVADSQRMAREAIGEAIRRLGAAGHEVAGCGVLVGAGMPAWSTEQILAVHVRMHKAEGEMFRDVLVAGARACGLEPATLRDKTAFDGAAAALGLTRARFDAQLAALGRLAGPPWDVHHKEAAAAALVALAARRSAAAA
jgi:hypothetical protein